MQLRVLMHRCSIFNSVTLHYKLLMMMMMAGDDLSLIFILFLLLEHFNSVIVHRR